MATLHWWQDWLLVGPASVATGGYNLGFLYIRIAVVLLETTNLNILKEKFIEVSQVMLTCFQFSSGVFSSVGMSVTWHLRMPAEYRLGNQSGPLDLLPYGQDLYAFKYVAHLMLLEQSFNFFCQTYCW